ncbi:proteophosphoglycan ppg4 [Rhodotorula toruloides]|uniref:Proteophosphoglycan ppg4 n=1 Tax=Rhodotorula toruloides TaxID=5286 RepID=A0A511KG90_RHOTO|nr:proteophosphoglycan ppg4 [Rhodotorula toruloides]
MSASFLNGLNLTSILPPNSQWIAPWVTQVLQSVEGELALGHSPYPAFEQTVLRIFYPSVAPGFRPMLWFLAGLFSLSIIIVLASLVLRLQQGRFWLFHRVDKTIAIPNISTIYGMCALAYASLAILSIVTAVGISKGESFPRYYLGLQAGWIAPLWVGFFCEAWATISAYIRKKGAFYRESRWKTLVALTLPFLLPVCAFFPVVIVMYIAAHSFNEGYRDTMSILAQLRVFDQSWTPAKGLDIGNLLTFFTLGEKFGAEMRDYSKYVRIGYLYIALTLLVTFAVYTTGASVEIRHLSATIKELRAQSKTPRLRPRSPLTFSRGTSSKSVQLPEAKTDRPPIDPLDNEFFAGVKRLWALLAWARNNRFYSACAIGLMLLVNAGIAFWLGVSPLSLMTNSAQLLVACWLNGILSTVVALLILFRSLDGSSPIVQRLRCYLPFLPFPPAISITDPSRAQLP